MSDDRTQREMVQDALYDWIEAVLAEKNFPCPIVWDGLGGTRPKAPFVSLQMIGGTRSTFPWKSRVDPETGERESRFDMRKTVSINGWGERCMERLDEIADSISSEKYRLMLRRNGVVVIVNGGFEPNKESTVKRKGSSKPLIDTGTMRNAVSYEVVKKK